MNDGELFSLADVEAMSCSTSRPGRALARRSHPETSKQAADEVAPQLGKLQEEALSLVTRCPGRTQAELAEIVGYRDSRRIGRRLPELLAGGRLVKGKPRRCTATGRLAATWSVG